MHICKPSHVRASRGFTLVELIVVIGIIVLLMSLLIPMVSKAYRTSVRTRMAADLHAIAQGLEAYKLDQKDYPRLAPYAAGQGSPQIDGAILLCWALVAPGPATSTTPQTNPPDGNDGPGFRAHGTSGTLYGPYVTLGALRVGDEDTSMGVQPGVNNSRAAFLDRYDHPIYYCPARPNSTASITAGNGFVADFSGGMGQQQPMYDHAYFCPQGQPNNSSPINLAFMQSVLGDANQNGQIDGSESANYTGPFILWSAGPDQNYNSVKSYVTNMQ